MADGKIKRMFVNKAQKDALIEYIERNPLLKNPCKLNNKISKQNINKKWDELASLLNKVGKMTGGAVKDSNTWRKTWQDLKANVKKRVSETRKYQMGTGGGPPLQAETSVDYESKITEMLDPVEIKGDNNISESQVIFEFVEDPEENKQLIFESKTQDILPALPKKSEEKQKPSVKVSTKSKSVTEALQVSTNISKEIEAKTSLKREYYKDKIEILRENLKIKKQKIELMKQDVKVKQEISDLLKIIVQNLNPSEETF